MDESRIRAVGEGERPCLQCGDAVSGAGEGGKYGAAGADVSAGMGRRGGRD